MERASQSLTQRWARMSEAEISGGCRMLRIEFECAVSDWLRFVKARLFGSENAEIMMILIQLG